MYFESKSSNGYRILIVRLAMHDCIDSERSLLDDDRLIASELRSLYSLESVGLPPLVAVDLSLVAHDLEAARGWFRRLMYLRESQFLSYVRKRHGLVILFGSEGVIHEPFAATRTLEDAIETLNRHQATMTLDIDLTPATALERLGASRICLVGCPEKDLGEIPSAFQQLAIEFSSVESLRDGDNVIFCLNGPWGLSDGTKRAVASCENVNFHPLAIVLTSSDSLDDDSLRALVAMEELELISTVLPWEEAASLPVYQDVDPSLVTKILGLVAGH